MTPRRLVIGIAAGANLFIGAALIGAQSPDLPEQIAAGGFLEGPAATESGELYFTDLQSNRIWRLDPSGVLKVVRNSAGYANGLALDDAGRLLAAECGDAVAGTPARITRTDLQTGKVEALASDFDGREFSCPNDIVVDGKGRVYFTDWVRPDFLPTAGPRLRNPFGVYRIDPDGRVHRLLVAPAVQAPNGVMVSPDDRTLYLVESNRAAGGRRRIVAFSIGEDGSLGPERLFHDFSPGRSGDGMAVDGEGNLWVAAGLNRPRPGGETMDTKAGIHVFAPDGQLRRFVPILTDLVTNVAFGGAGRRTAFVTAGNAVFRIPSSLPGTRR